MSLKLIYSERKYWPLFWTQFFGSLNDNLLKNALVMMVTFKSVTLWGLDSQSLVGLASGVFILPFFLFSSLAGQIADKYDKPKLVKIVKVVEIFIMILASLGFYLQNFALLIFSLFLMGIHSTVFGPVKYSTLPEILPEADLVAGNAYIELGTFMAILIGTIGGGLVVAQPNAEIWAIAGLMLMSLAGLATSLFMPKITPANPNLKMNWNPITDTWNTIKLSMPVKAVFYSIFGISWFWFFGACLLSLLPIYVKDMLHGGESVVTLFLICFTIGIALGSVLAEKLSFRQVEIGIVPLGSFFMTVFLLDLSFSTHLWTYDNSIQLLNVQQYWQQSHSLRILVDLFLLALAGGVYTVPLYTLIQQRSDRESRSRVIASNNIINALFMVVSTICMIGFHALKLGIPDIFLVVAIMNLVVSVYIYYMVPEFTLRFFTWVACKIMYKVKSKGLERIPLNGSAILVCNHVSFVDWLIISGVVQRPIRFVMYYKFATNPLYKWLLTQAKVIPIAGSKEDPAILEAAYQKISAEIKNGELVCIFPEGKVTLDGDLGEFKAGVEQILSRDPVPVYPMALKGMWGSFFSKKDRPAFKKMPKRFRHEISLVVGEKVDATMAKVSYLKEKVFELLYGKVS